MSLSELDAAYVRGLVRRRSAIVLDESKNYLIESRLELLISQIGYPSVRALIAAAESGATDLQTRVVEALTTHETSFFRDVQPFETLKHMVLPALITAREQSRSLTIWCGACSTGQEPYSIAMLIHEYFPELVTWPVRILATDLSEQTLARARSGLFNQLEMNRGLPAMFLLKYFDRKDMLWEVKPSVKKLVEFSQLNLIGPWDIPVKPDIVLMRNVMIYFDHDTKKKILEKVRHTMAPDGALFLGAAETTLNIDDYWVRVTQKNYAYYQASAEEKPTW